MPRIITPPEVRFWAKVNKNAPPPETAPELGGCWLWEAGKTSHGYGVFHPTKQRTAMAHRWAMYWADAPGPITKRYKKEK